MRKNEKLLSSKSRLKSGLKHVVHLLGSLFMTKKDTPLYKTGDLAPKKSNIKIETTKSQYEFDHDCKINDNVVEPSLECIRDCADVKYVCNCNKYK